MRRHGLPFVLCCFATFVASQTYAQNSQAVNSQAYKAHRVAEAVPAFASVCLQDNLSVQSAAEAAKRAGIGLSAPTQYKAAGKPKVEIVARRNRSPIIARDEVFTWFECRVDIRGTWADVLLPEVKEALASNGFSRGSFKTTTFAPGQAYGGEKVVVYPSNVTRGGKKYLVTVVHAPSGGSQKGNMSVTYISGTRINIELQ